MNLAARISLAGAASLVVASASMLLGASAAPPQDPSPKAEARAKAPADPQTREHSKRVKVDPSTIVVDDGDTVRILWPGGDPEIVRILGIDAPETRHPEHNLPIDQSYGPEARAFARGAFAAASEVEILRASTLDPFKRSLAYLFVNDKNYSLLILNARLAQESVSAFGDNGFPEIAAELQAAAKAAGPLPFEPPHLFRRRMRGYSDWIKNQPAGE